jgi:hypothetical protein
MFGNESPYFFDANMMTEIQTGDKGFCCLINSYFPDFDELFW